ncbi:MAG: tRNA (adenosine(37)-N6)-threonylcarbamoyltransferase complex dimerization subunit type 1 TsaB [Chloroflexi bacterium]|nr:tRNA (adenosine(37)-N6)-threonylcarbamoyltransferase complex dimerization subunit type 1 TsaB [Chloroflexota bacterium]
MQIAIDTTSEMAGLALTDGEKLLTELTWHCGQNHTTELLPQLAYLLQKTGTSLQAADCIFVATGPGSYNGLRVGVSTAKGLAFSLGIPVVGIGTLEVEAYQHAASGLPVCAVANAGRGELGAALYQQKAGQWRQLVAEHITTLEMLCGQIATRTIFCGEYVTAIAGELKQSLGRKAVIPPGAAVVRRASFLAELGRQRAKSGSYDNLAALQPLYLRRPPITQPRRQITLEGEKHGILVQNS